MKALVKAKKEPGLWLQEVPIPKIADNEVLIKVKKTAICGTDLHIYNWDEWAKKTIVTPMHVGHEFSGTVVEKGPLVPDSIAIGARVSAEGHITCGVCRNCKGGRQHLCPYTKGIGVHIPGAFAEYIAVPMSNVFLLPDIISDDIAAIFDPFGNAVHTALSFNCTGEDVLVTGAGPIGIMCAIVAKHAGARHVIITDVKQQRIDFAAQFSGIIPVNVANTKITSVMAKLKMHEGFDVGLEASGNNVALKDMADVMLNGGKIALLGLYPGNIDLDLNHLIFKGLELKGIYGREMYETWYKMVTLIESGLDIRKIITHQYHYSEFETAFNIMNAGDCGKIILNWQD